MNRQKMLGLAEGGIVGGTRRAHGYRLGIVEGSQPAKEIVLQWKVGDNALKLTADPGDFLVKSSVPLSSETDMLIDTMYWPRGKVDAKRFYAWLRDNENNIKQLDIDGLKKIWNDISVRYKSH